jgi:protein-S-isoprenylcysteine O-methyltransferase Ste14
MNIRLGKFFFRYRNVLGPLIFLAALFIGKPSYPLDRAELNSLFDALGIAIVVLGEALRMTTIGYEYIERGGRNRQVYASKLVQGGVFAHCRNPLYVGNIMLAVGISLVVHSLLFYLIILPLVGLVYMSIVAAEEAFLGEKFGQEYLQYCQRVHRWIPRWRGWTQSIAGTRFSWRRVLVKEYNTVFIVLLVLTGVKLWSDYAVRGSSALPSRDSLAIAVAVWFVAYMFVRALKKGGYVRA